MAKDPTAAAVKQTLKAHVEIIKNLADDRAAMAAEAGDKALARVHKAFAADIVRQIKAAHAEAAA